MVVVKGSIFIYTSLGSQMLMSRLFNVLPRWRWSITGRAGQASNGPRGDEEVGARSEYLDA